MSKEVRTGPQKALPEKEKILFSGFAAQDAERAANEAVYDFSGVALRTSLCRILQSISESRAGAFKAKRRITKDQ